jgi:hypothetical protein
MLEARRFGSGLIAVLVPLALFAGGTARAQNRDVAFDAVTAQPRGLPDLPPSGAWGEVINVTSRWLVIQNHAGQQFPIAIEDITEFLIRWPSSLDALGPDVLVEAVGQNIGSNTLRTDHIDLFAGTDRTLVTPTYNDILPNNMVVTTVDPGFNRFMNAWDISGQNLLYGWAYPIAPGLSGIPSRLHVVGNPVDASPIRIAIPGNNIATIVPDNTGRITVSQVTRGSSTFARKGDYAFLLPLQTTPRGLAVSQLVLYKQVPLGQFNPNR